MIQKKPDSIFIMLMCGVFDTIRKESLSTRKQRYISYVYNKLNPSISIVD